MAGYQLFTDATSDITKEFMSGLPEVKIIPMNVEIGGREYTYGPGGDITPEQFYELQRQGNFAVTSQINPETYKSAFEAALKDGSDVLYLCFSSGLSGTIQSAELAMDDLREKYPDRRIKCIDTLCASLGEGFLVHEAAKKQAEGLDFDELCDWVDERKLKVCHWFTVDIFDHLKHGGRVSNFTAAAGTLLQIKPLLHVDEEGRLAVMGKPRGRKQAIAMQIEKLKSGMDGSLGNLVTIGHGSNPEGAEQLKNEVMNCCPDADIHILDIGPIIGAHTGPGMLAVIYWGSNR